MKKIFLLFIFTIFCFPHNGVAQLRSTANEVFELSSIAFRLAGAEEYMQCPIPSYAKDIDEYFAPYSDHELIKYIKEIREKYFIGYDAVANAAACLLVHDKRIATEQDGIRMHGKEIAINPAFDLARISEIDERWTAEVYGKYVNLLNDFYKQSNFNKFYSAHRKLYSVAASRADELLKNLNTKWFSSFFGAELGDVRILVSLCNGDCNYAFSLANKNNGFGIIIGCRGDVKGLPVYSRLMPQTIIHELSHAFTNKLINDVWDDIEPAALEIYPHVEERMLEIAIGFPKNVMTEWFTDLCTNMYFRENGAIKSISPALQIAIQQNRGFIWMERSVDFMNGFYENRDLYPTVKEYMPQLVLFINEIAASFDQIIAAFDNRNPRVVETIPRPYSTVSRNIDRIVIKFSEPMATNSYGYGRTNEEGVLQVPARNGDKEFWLDDKTFIIPIKNKKLKPNKKYGLKLNRYFFTSVKEYPMAENFTLYFNTCEE